MAILLVHGRSQEGKDPKSLEKTWIDSLRYGAMRAGMSLPDGLKTFFPFYGDALKAFVEPNCTEPPEIDNIPRNGGKRTMAEDIYDELGQDFERVAKSRAAARGIDLTLRAHGLCDRNGDPDSDDELRSAGLSCGSRHPDAEFRGATLNSFLRIVEQVNPGAGELAARVFGDVTAYLGNPAARDSVLGIVDKSLTECIVTSKDAGEPVVVFAHSLGSVVVHDLFTAKKTGDVDLLLTAGSPLGIAAIRKRLQSARTSSAWPALVRTWVNASDPNDVVALIPVFGRRGFFAGSYKINRDTRCDVLNLVDIDNDTDNHHGITGYLSDPGIVKVIIDALTHR